MAQDRIPLRIVGLSSAEIRGEAYVLILAEENGPRRVPIVMGRPEAQAIAMELEGVKSERPGTHDLFVSFAHAFGVKLEGMLISKFEDGVFYSDLTFRDDEGRIVVMDSRTSDAIALALRTGTRIYTTLQVLESAGFVMPDETEEAEDSDGDEAEAEIRDSQTDSNRVAEPEESSYHREPNPENFSIEELERTLARLIEKEDYEEASRISAILDRKKNRNNERD